MKCNQVIDIKIVYSDSALHYQKFKPYKYKGYYSFSISGNDLLYLKNDYCNIIELTKKTRFRIRQQMLFEKQQILTENQQRNQDIVDFRIFITRQNDELIIQPLIGEIYFDSDTNYPEIGRGIPLVVYATGSQYKINKLSKELIDFANIAITYRNNQVKNDTLLVDSLRKPYPLLPYSITAEK